jgi:hypothetical protein
LSAASWRIRTDRRLHDIRVQVLARLEREDDVIAALREMMTLFPEDEAPVSGDPAGLSRAW